VVCLVPDVTAGRKGREADFTTGRHAEYDEQAKHDEHDDLVEGN